MEHFQQAGQSAAIKRDLVREFYDKINDMSSMQKLRMVYTYFTNHKPIPTLDENKILNRVLYETEFGQKIKETEQELKKQKKFKFPWVVRSEMDKSKKKKDLVLAFVLNVRGELEWPKLYPVYGSNMIIMRSKPYLFDPRAVLSFGKYRCIIIKEIDRMPVCNLDYAEIKARGDSTESDELLIKATLKAMIGAPKKEMNKTMIIIIIVIIIAVGAFFMMKG